MADKVKISELTSAASVSATDTIAGVVSTNSRSVEIQQILMSQSTTETRWKDDKYVLTRAAQGNTDKPDYDYTNLGLLFPKNDTSEIGYIIAQLNHDWKIGTDIWPHIHFIQDADVAYTFKIDYRWYDQGEAVPGSFTTLTIDQLEFTYVSGSILQTAYPATAIDGSGISGISSFLDIKIYRADNVGSADLLTKEFDIHYEIDAFGSATQDAK